MLGEGGTSGPTPIPDPPRLFSRSAFTKTHTTEQRPVAVGQSLDGRPGDGLLGLLEGHVVVGREQPVEMQFLDPSQLRDVLQAIDARYRLFVELLAISGLRFGEGAALRRCRCDLERSRITVAENAVDVRGKLVFGSPKTHQVQTVVLPNFLSNHLEEHLTPAGAPDTFVFTSPRGGPVRYGNFLRRVWKPAPEEVGIPEMGVHALRHTCAALLIAQGAHPKAIQRHLGHRSITTTLDRYGHCSKTSRTGWPIGSTTRTGASRHPRTRPGRASVSGRPVGSGEPLTAYSRPTGPASAIA